MLFEQKTKTEKPICKVYLHSKDIGDAEMND